MATRNPKAISVYANKDIRTRTVDLCFTRGEGTGSEGYAKPMEFVEPSETLDVYPGVTVSLPFDDASQLMDQLWFAGVRPSDDIGSTGQLSALKDVVKAKDEHIADLRRLLNHHLGIVP